jgi:hypothetical protein
VAVSGLFLSGIGGFSPQDHLSGSLGAGEVEGGETAAANRLEGVKAFPRDYDSGSMAVRSLMSCLESYHLTYQYARLLGVSGAAFKFVYDSTEAYEPLRDLSPIDVLGTACAAMGFEDAHWMVDEPIEVVKRVVKGEIDAGRPVIAPFLATHEYHGFTIITGYDYDEDLFHLQGAFHTPEGAAIPDGISVPVPEAWDGPTVSPAGWAGNPVFVIGERSGEGTGYVQYYKDIVESGIGAMRGGRLTYGSRPGEHVYMSTPGPHEASYGLEAYGILSSDVGSSELTRVVEGDTLLNFGFIWRIDAQVGQLEHDRRNGALFLRYLRQGLPAKRVPLLEEIIDNFNRTADDAADLRKVFWDDVRKAREARITRDEVPGYVASSKSIVIGVVDDKWYVRELEGQGYGIYSSPWGPVVVNDSEEKRLQARLLVRSLQSRERQSLSMLEELAEYIDLRVDPDRSEERKRPKTGNGPKRRDPGKKGSTNKGSDKGDPTKQDPDENGDENG